jgi:ribosomal protein S18 acetylase RimI-like enzyme
MARAAQGDHDERMQVPELVSLAANSGADLEDLAAESGAAVRKAAMEDVPALIPVLARAFDQDPFINWVVRQDERRLARMEWTFEVMLRQMSGELNETHATRDLAGAALWKRPGEFKLPLIRQLRLLPAFARAMGWGKIPTFLKMLAHTELLHDQLVPEPHYYLFVLGVDPSRQGQGLGAQLLEPVLALCDREGKRAYLETSREDNLGFYRRQGFEVVHIVERAGWPKFWMMTRAAQKPA